MAKNFPYFKFIATEWLTGDIVYEDFELQGLFINICALYWQRDGKLTIEDITKRYKNEKLIQSLSGRYFSLSDGCVSIKFLDEQLIDANHISKVNSENGKKGAERRKELAMAKQTLSENKRPLSKEEKEEEKEEKNNIKQRKTSFANSIKPFLETYGKEMCTEFYTYWTEHGEKDKKMRFEKEKTFGIKQRLDRWKSNKSKFSNSTQKKDVLFVTPEGVEITDSHVLHVYQQTGKV